jgi:hypothetical protein
MVPAQGSRAVAPRNIGIEGTCFVVERKNVFAKNSKQLFPNPAPTRN